RLVFGLGFSFSRELAAFELKRTTVDPGSLLVLGVLVSVIGWSIKASASLSFIPFGSTLTTSLLLSGVQRGTVVSSRVRTVASEPLRSAPDAFSQIHRAGVPSRSE